MHSSYVTLRLMFQLVEIIEATTGKKRSLGRKSGASRQLSQALTPRSTIHLSGKRFANIQLRPAEALDQAPRVLGLLQTIRGHRRQSIYSFFLIFHFMFCFTCNFSSCMIVNPTSTLRASQMKGEHFARKQKCLLLSPLYRPLLSNSRTQNLYTSPHPHRLTHIPLTDDQG